VEWLKMEEKKNGEKWVYNEPGGCKDKTCL
jgi:hypothetical protein